MASKGGTPNAGIVATQPVTGEKIRFPHGGVVATVISNSNVCAGVSAPLLEFFQCVCVCHGVFVCVTVCVRVCVYNCEGVSNFYS